MSSVPRQSRRSPLLLSLLTPLLLAGAAAPVIAQMGRTAPPAVAAIPSGGPTVRVLLAQAQGWELDPQEQPLRLLDERGRSVRLLSPEERLTLGAGAGGVIASVVAADGTARRLAPQASLGLEPVAPNGQPGVLSFGGQRYRGRLLIRPGQGGKLMAINQLSLETYLPSVVGSEMPASWPQAALRAQAVAARTYALSQLKPAAAFDLKATVASQVYRGLAAETDSTRAAVTATRGQVLTLEGQLIQAVFHSSSGGSTEDSGQVWSRQLPYLVSVPDFDDSSPVSRWNLRIEPEQLRRQFRETGGVRRIDVLASSGTGRIRRARVIGPNGSLELSGSELRQRLGLRSTRVSFSLQPVAMPAAGGPIDQAVRDTAPAAAPTRTSPTTQPLLVDSASGTIIGTMDDSNAGAAAATALERGLPAAAATARSSEPAYALVVEGRGFGHGVGMSQWGAYALALQGRSHEQILRHYYRGVQLSSYPSP